MNIVIPKNTQEDKKPKVNSNFKYFILLVIFPIFCAVVGVYFLKDVYIKVSYDPVNVIKDTPVSFNEMSSIEIISDSYGIPSVCMVRLSEWLTKNVNGRYGGVGLFQVKLDDLNWIQDQVLLETIVDLEDDVQNTHIACYLIKRFRDSGYSWKECFLIYVYGFSAVHIPGHHSEFLEFLFNGVDTPNEE